MNDKEQCFQIFLKSLLIASENVSENYFNLPVAYDQQYVQRERNYCYELYSQIKNVLPGDFPYYFNGEINKAGHPLITPECGDIIPDFIVHNPGSMGPNDNLVIIEVKTVLTPLKGFLKDIETINCMTTLNNGYYKGILLIFGMDNERRKKLFELIYRKTCNTKNVLLIFHDAPLTRARIV
jgi:hypothetical protein